MERQKVVYLQWLRAVLIFSAVGAIVLWKPSSLWGQIDDYYRRAVGGVSIDPEGILQNAQVDATGQLRQILLKQLAPVPQDLAQPTELRKISLRGLESAIQQALEAGKPLPDEVKYLAGLQQIRYVFVDPERQDIIIAGPAEGWKVDDRGFLVGVTTGRPVMLLDDLLVALRTAQQAAQGGISCSIDPTPQGLQQLQAYVSTLSTIGQPDVTLRNIEKALGLQQITVQGVPADSHFARVLVAADYRMKRLAMGFDPVPKGVKLPSYLAMISAGPKGINNMMPRWWLAPNYQPLLRDEEGLSWEFRGGSVKAMAEEDFLTATGQRQHTGRANPMAQKWAELMTAQYDRLAVAEPIFGQLRNCMDLAILGAMMVQYRLPEKAGYSFPVLLEGNQVPLLKFAPPKQTPTIAKAMKKGTNWVITASGGVQIPSWQIVQKTEKSDSLGAVRTQAATKKAAAWWWN
ncbi:MAG: DUF1598 domain-containing protein [Thermoguttaceae bacterium]|nr:DUF1598 domain-containing protein [Thermoguttaceae bacterium]MDW8037961.1 DUF1598 domain-containing protein [Thermoguttaceae bacterium]